MNVSARSLVTTFGAGALLIACAPTVLAAPGPAATTSCTGADFALVSAGVATAMSAYLYSHPDVNALITQLEASGSDQSTMELVEYFAAHPTVKAETDAIRQPIADFDRRCGYGKDSQSNAMGTSNVL